MMSNRLKWPDLPLLITPQVRALAEAHHGFSELAQICELTEDRPKLYHYMRHLQGTPDDEDSFVSFMLQRLLDHNQVRQVILHA